MPKKNKTLRLPELIESSVSRQGERIKASLAAFGGELRTGPVLAGIAALVITGAVILFTNGKNSINIDEFETGKVALRDVIASEPVSFVDAEATRQRTEARIREVPAVFKYDISVNNELQKKYSQFTLLSLDLFKEYISAENYEQRINEAFLSVFEREALRALFMDPDREASLEIGRKALNYFLETGIFLLPETNEEKYNPVIAELLHNYGERFERERIVYEKVITKKNLDSIFRRYIENERLSREFSAGAGSIVRSLLRENVFFSPDDTLQRAAEVRSHVNPVYRFIDRGDRVIRKGFVITEEEMTELRALKLSMAKRDPRLIAGRILMLFVICLFLVSRLGKRATGRQLRPAEIYLMIILVSLYLGGAALANNFVPLSDNFPVSILIPTALIVMLPGILLGYPVSVAAALLLPLGAFLSESFNMSAYIFALCSGFAAAHVLKNAQKRMDLVKAGLLLAAANAASILIILLINQAPASEYGAVIFWAAFNGLASGLLVTGILPVLEQALNAITPFRLIELSDLNSPVLKRLFQTAPGTYSHSIMVANLAESACREIGANALLAKVGSYYHDIGKMDEPFYFVENQDSHNKHKDISPRQSASVIKNHVKTGVEKARALGLPEAVVDFIAEHHGNSIITWFYNEALKKEKGNPAVEDYTYPGNPPGSKESAVVMLADITEAAVRVIKKPAPAKFEKCIRELFDNKIDHGQLSRSDLTFRELETIKQAFIKVLSGYYHSRIEYPRLPRAARVRAGKGKK